MTLKPTAITALIAATEREFLGELDDHEDMEPPCGITAGMIRAARDEIEEAQRQSKLLHRLRAKQ